MTYKSGGIKLSEAYLAQEQALTGSVMRFVVLDDVFPVLSILAE